MLGDVLNIELIMLTFGLNVENIVGKLDDDIVQEDLIDASPLSELMEGLGVMEEDLMGGGGGGDLWGLEIDLFVFCRWFS